MGLHQLRGMHPQRLSRRALLRSAFLGGTGLLAAHVLGCGDGDGGQPTVTATRPAATPTSPSPGPTAAPSVLRWRRVIPPSEKPPQPRRDHSLVTNGTSLYVFGGRRGAEELSDPWAFSANVWAGFDSGMSPPPRHGHNAIWDAGRDRIVIFGGQQGSAFFNDTWAFDPTAGRSGSWAELPAGDSVPAPRYGAGDAFDPAGRLLVTHGFTNSGRFDDTWSLDLAGGSWTDISPSGERPVKRCLMRAAWDTANERLLMFGGQTTDTPFLGDLWALESNGWREITSEPRPSPRSFYAMVFDDESGRLILFGGRTADGPVNDLWYFDSASETWEQQLVEGEGPSPRFGHDAVWHPRGRFLLLLGGNDGSNDLNDLWELSVPA